MLPTSQDEADVISWYDGTCHKWNPGACCISSGSFCLEAAAVLSHEGQHQGETCYKLSQGSYVHRHQEHSRGKKQLAGPNG